MPTPRGGGIAVIGAVLLAWIAAHAEPDRRRQASLGSPLAPGCWRSFSGSTICAVCRPRRRLVAQAAARRDRPLALPGPTGSGLADPVVYLVAIGLLWVWWINLFNFMDGIDGLAGSEAAAIGAGLLLFAAVGAGVDPRSALLAAAILGAAIGFLVWNWSPARIFLGDVGSVPLGYVLGFLLLDLAVRGHWKIALILPLYFLADATMTLLRRLLRGERVWQAHRQHFYQQAVRRGLGHAAVVRRVIAADLVLIGCGWAAENGWGSVSLAASRRDRRGFAGGARPRLLRLAEACPTRRPYIRGDERKPSPDPTRADFGQRQERDRRIRRGAGRARRRR